MVNKSIDELGLSTRAIFALKRLGVYTANDLTTCQAETIKATKRWGKSIQAEITRKRTELIEGSAYLSAWDAEKDYIITLLKENDVGTDVLDSISLGTYKRLQSSGHTKLWELVFKDKDSLIAAGIDETDALDIINASNAYLKELNISMPEPELPPEPEDEAEVQTFPEAGKNNLLSDEKNHEVILNYTRDHDIKLSDTKFAVSAYNRMSAVGWSMLSDIILLPDDEFYKLPSMGKETVGVIREGIDSYIEAHTDGIRAMLSDVDELAATDELVEISAEVSPDTPNEIVDNMESFVGGEDECSQPEDLSTDTQENKAYQETIPEHEAYSGMLIDSLGLSVRSTNALHRKKINTVDQLLALSANDLAEIKNLGEKSIKEILGVQHMIRTGKLAVESTEPEGETLAEESKPELSSEYRECLLRYARAKDVPLASLPLTTRAHNRLEALGYNNLSDIILLSADDFRQMRSLGANSVASITNALENYINTHQNRILAMYNGEDVLRLSDEELRTTVLELYKTMGFKGLSLNEMQEKLSLDDTYLEQLKAVIGKLIADGELEYVDYRCHRVYPTLKEFLPRCENISERNIEIITKRLSGLTLQATADEYALTRERVRQIVDNNIDKAKKLLRIKTGLEFFDEDYFRYLFENYSFNAGDAAPWLNIPDYVFNYFDTLDIKQGKKSLEEALIDSESLDAGLRLKIRRYLNRDKILIDGRWINLKRSELEEVLVRKLCRDDVSFEDFTQLYNDFLERENVPFDEKVYYTDAVLRTRENRMRESARFLLWKQNKRLRYYDIDGTDFTELLETLSLDAYENIELSSQKFMNMYPELMDKYDIRDQYELHNLLNKIVPRGGKNCIDFSRMPMIKFGQFDRDSAILNIIIDNAPIGLYELADLVQEEYGYDRDTVALNYLKPFKVYYHQGIYSIDQKAMSSNNMQLLSEALKDDFYYLDEIRKIYSSLVPGADTEEINPYNLKSMGFIVLSRYALRNHNSLDAYFTHLLTVQDITDISTYRKRYGYVQMFTQVLMNLRRDLTVIEFEPNQLINFRKLEKAGITKNDIAVFCQNVYDFVEAESYFNIHSIRQDGFKSELFDLGFSDWFYANLLLSDERFSNDRFFGNMIFYKGNKKLSVKIFLEDFIIEQSSIDLYDLMNELTERYGLVIEARGDIMTRLYSSDVYYDKYLDRYYASESLYFHELDTM